MTRLAMLQAKEQRAIAHWLSTPWSGPDEAKALAKLTSIRREISAELGEISEAVEATRYRKLSDVAKLAKVARA